MLQLIAKEARPKENSALLPATTLTLPLELRQKSRQRVMLDNGEEAAVHLKRGTVLFHGDLLLTADNIAILVQAAAEELSTVHCPDPLLFARACYHLGNRHIPLQIEKDKLLYPHDHVLDEMLQGLGLIVSHVSAPFEPEGGAYNDRTGHHHAH